MKRAVLLGTIAALVVAVGLHAAGGLSGLYQLTFKQGGTSAVSRTARSKISDYISVKDFGATGDGATNDTAAITAAITYAGNFVNVYFPCPGSYQTTTWGTIPCGYESLVPATGAVPRPLGTKIQETLSAKDFGAVGDGVTNDTTAIGNLINAAVGTQLLNFPCPGTYISSTYGTLACGMYLPPISATGAVLRPVSRKLAEYLSVKDFGAVGDGVADDTAAIQAAVNYASTSVANVGVCSTHCLPSGVPAEVLFPTGLYNVTDTITVTGMVSLRGDSTELTYSGARIVQQTCGKDLFKVAGESSIGAASLQFINLALIAKDTCSATYVAGTALIHVPSTVAVAASVYIRDVWFQTPEDYAINIETGDDYVITDNTFDVSARKAIKLGSAGHQVTESTIARNYFFFIDVGVLDLVNVGRLQFVGNRIGGRDTPRTGYIIDCLNTTPVACDTVVVDHNTSLYANGLYLTKYGTATITGNIARLATAPLIKFSGGGTIGNVVVANNVLSGVFTGTSAIDGAGASLTYSSLMGNSMTGTDGTGGPAGTPITLTGGSNSNISLAGNVAFGFSNPFNVTGTSVSVEFVDLNSQQTVAGTKTITGNGTNPAIIATGGSGGAAGGSFTGTSGNAGAIATGNGAGAGFSGTGGATVGAHGVDGTGGAGGGRGVVGTGTSGWEGVVGTGSLTAAGGAFVGTSTGPAVQSYGAIIPTRVALTYSGTMATNAALADIFSITATNGTAFTISNPTNPLTGQRITYTIRNTSGGALGAATWGSGAFKMGTWAQPATGFSRSIEFIYDGTNWVEIARSTIDVPN